MKFKVGDWVTYNKNKYINNGTYRSMVNSNKWLMKRNKVISINRDELIVTPEDNTLNAFEVWDEYVVKVSSAVSIKRNY